MKHPVNCINVLILFLNTSGLDILIFNQANFEFMCWVFLSDTVGNYFRKQNIKHQKRCVPSCHWYFSYAVHLLESFSCLPSATSVTYLTSG